MLGLITFCLIGPVLNRGISEIDTVKFCALIFFFVQVAKFVYVIDFFFYFMIVLTQRFRACPKRQGERRSEHRPVFAVFAVRHCSAGHEFQFGARRSHQLGQICGQTTGHHQR